MSSKKFFIIGLSGTTNSGKSTLTSMLQSAFPHAFTMCQDSYFYGPDDPRVPLESQGFQNWECLGAMDMEKMVAHVNSWMAKQESNKTPALLIIEGFLIFNHRQLSSLFDQKYFIKVDYSTSAKRRVFRTYVPPDVPGYFESVVWPKYLQNLEDIQDQTQIEYLDGSKSLDDLYNQLVQGIKAVLSGDKKNNS
ncbi:nicotinamide riboside kinase 1 [Aplysia californica]|uniref:Nicotinamide riboside kinase 1 n=1 Tax=Aplysia californica TaxID=6500 RepID=A0ABM0JWH3_APLCA|nr:nicotinamide riboside kinase 1 [Aplysia californica]XP_012940690.1 nicotinamide riboside kinase 1 [Aplysia californica]